MITAENIFYMIIGFVIGVGLMFLLMIIYLEGRKDGRIEAGQK